MLKRVCKTGGLGWYISCNLEATWKDLKEALKKAAMPDTSRWVQLCPASWEKSAGDAPVASTSPSFHSSAPMLWAPTFFPSFLHKQLSSHDTLAYQFPSLLQTLFPIISLSFNPNSSSPVFNNESHTLVQRSLLTRLHFFLVMICTQTICLDRLWFTAKHRW